MQLFQDDIVIALLFLLGGARLVLQLRERDIEDVFLVL